MPRTARGLVDGGLYHLINRGNGKQRVFHADHDYLVFLDLLAHMQQDYPFKLYAYCLMPNHFHLLVEVESADQLSQGMHWLMTTQVRRHHLRYETTGHLWQGRFKSQLVGTDGYLLNLLRYIEGNPVRAGLVASARTWRWSSLLLPGQESSPALPVQRPQLSEPPVERPDDWLAFVDTPLSEFELSELSTGGTVPDQRDRYVR